MKIITVVATLLFLPSCMIGPSVNWDDPFETESRVLIENDDFKKITVYQGPNIEGLGPEMLFIRAWREYGSSHVRYQIYITARSGSKWRFFDSAYDDKGNNLDVTLISRDAKYAFDENVGVNIDRLYLDKSKETGIRIKLYGKGGEEIFFIPGGYVQGFLAKVDSLKSAY